MYVLYLVVKVGGIVVSRVRELGVVAILVVGVCGIESGMGWGRVVGIRL